MRTEKAGFSNAVGRGGTLKKLAWAMIPALSVALGCHSMPAGKPLAALNPGEAAGHQVFASACSACHYADSEKGLNGPGLKGMFRKPYLPSGSPANDPRVTSVLLHGRNMMPAFGNTLSEQELKELLAYLHTL